MKGHHRKHRNGVLVRVINFIPPTRYNGVAGDDRLIQAPKGILWFPGHIFVG